MGLHLLGRLQRRAESAAVPHATPQLCTQLQASAGAAAVTAFASITAEHRLALLKATGRELHRGQQQTCTENWE